MYNNVLVPIALDHQRDTNEALNVAKALVKEGGRVTALHVMEEVPAYVAQYLPEGQLIGNVREFEKRLKDTLAGEENVDVAVVSGQAGHAIVEYAKRHKVDCIVVASHRPGLTDYFLGSTAARVVRHATCAVHVTR